jgi:hypothetical protein
VLPLLLLLLLLLPLLLLLLLLAPNTCHVWHWLSPQRCCARARSPVPAGCAAAAAAASTTYVLLEPFVLGLVAQQYLQVVLLLLLLLLLPAPHVCYLKQFVQRPRMIRSYLTSKPLCQGS